jgi:hypothetical protein
MIVTSLSRKVRQRGDFLWQAMKQIPVGAKGSLNLLIQPEHIANRFKDAILPPVLATPVMIMVMENAALNAIRAYSRSRRERGRHSR